MSHLPLVDSVWTSRSKGALVFVIAGAILLGAGCGDDGDSDSRQINLIATENQITEIDNGPGGPSEGDSNVFASPLEDADGGAEAGNLYGIQTTVSLGDQTEVVQGSFTFKLEDGTISVGGLSEYQKGANALTKGEAFERPIIGGTGAYSGASGVDTTTLNADGRYEHELELDD
ncbi:MAG: allene oxide cyclase barrel-like domain-containing protein [Solirubrobacterales bacterium]